MSRLGRIPVPLPKGVEVKQEGIILTVKGPKGSLDLKVMPIIGVNVEEDKIVVSLKKDKADHNKWLGLYRSLIANMVIGTTEKFQKNLAMVGVGYRANVQGNRLNLQVGYSHPTGVDIPDGIDVEVEKNTKIKISGIDKQKVGQFAADVRSVRPPEPFQGKGIRYEDERVRRKAGKSAKKG
jgi:large subunit ribosomal protein L6